MTENETNTEIENEDKPDGPSENGEAEPAADTGESKRRRSKDDSKAPGKSNRKGRPAPRERRAPVTPPKPLKTPADYWEAYLGEKSPVEFMLAAGIDYAERVNEYVRKYMASHPSLYGIPLREGSWRKTFMGYSPNIDEVTMELVRHLENLREDWEPAVASRPQPAPEPGPEAAAEQPEDEDSEAPEQTDMETSSDSAPEWTDADSEPSDPSAAPSEDSEPSVAPAENSEPSAPSSEDFERPETPPTE